MRKIRIETLIVVVVLAVTVIADTIDLATSAWDWLKVVKIIAALVGLVITWQQLARSSPYHKDLLSPSDLGSYTVDGDVVTARWNGWTDSTQAGAAGAEITAKSLVRGLVRRYKDTD